MSGSRHTHLFHELVETDILYAALLPHRENNVLNTDFVERSPNRVQELIDDERDWTDVIKVIDAADDAGDRTITLNADVLTQTVVCYFV